MEKTIKIKPDSVLHFPLGDLFSFKATDLFNDPNCADSDAFVLALALAYNDLKGSLLLLELLTEFQPSTARGQISARAGNNAGGKWHAERMVLSTLNELKILVEEKKDLLKKEPLKSAVAKIRKKDSKDWETFFRFCTDEKLANQDLLQLRTFLRRVRNNIGYHYADTSYIRSGYESAFSTKRTHGDWGFFIRGKNMETSRFLFADAAIEAFLINELQYKSDKRQKAVKIALRSAHAGIYGLVQSYMLMRNINFRNHGDATIDFPMKDLE